MTASLNSDKNNRALALDQARGVAVIAMVIYHLAWDLSHFGIIETSVAIAPGWRLFAQAIAASFLAIAGVSLALGADKALDRRAFAMRLGRIAGAAALVTLATRLAFPQSYIFFGILHCIAVSSMIAALVLRAPPWAAALAGLAFLALPSAYRSEAFEGPALVWLGLGKTPPVSNDFVPVFPWTGFMLLGLAAGRLFGPWLRSARVLRLPPLAWLGRWSLPIYLVHQPLLYGGLMLAIQAGLLNDRKAEALMTRSCAVECQTAGAAPSVCAAACRCVTDEMRRLPLWRKALEDSFTVAERQQADAIGRACYAEALRVPARKP